MERGEVEREVRRLAPWYYRWDLGGVRTDETAPCDDQGHREVSCPAILPGFWQGKTVLDVACNEGAYALGALGHGARRVTGFDCRPANVEKARFLARFFGAQGARFEVATCDSWLDAHPDERFDVVLMCGILYHLRDPLGTIRRYAAVAREWVYVTCCVQGSEEPGFTRTSEIENIAASHEAASSLMPNNAETLVAAFRAAGFEPVHIEEARKPDFFDGVCLLLRNCASLGARCESLADEAVEVHIAPIPAADDPGRLDLFAAVYNREPTRRSVRLELRAPDAEGSSREGDIIDLPPRAMPPAAATSSSVHRVITIPRPRSGSSPIELIARDARSGEKCGGARLSF